MASTEHTQVLLPWQNLILLPIECFIIAKEPAKAVLYVQAPLDQLYSTLKCCYHGKYCCP